MSKKQKARIKDLERTLRASVARNAIVARENRELWAAYEAVRVERDELQRQYDAADRESTNAWMSNIALRNRIAEAEGQVDSLSHDLGECQAGREIEIASVEHWKTMHSLTNEKRKIAIDLLNTSESKLEKAERSLRYHEIKAGNHAKWYEDLLKENKKFKRWFDDSSKRVAEMSWDVANSDRELKISEAVRHELRAENAELKKELTELQDQIETAHRWKTYADSIGSQIEILQTAIDERDERLDNIRFFLSDGDE